jgi:hypothetical protein
MQKKRRCAVSKAGTFFVPIVGREFRENMLKWGNLCLRFPPPDKKYHKKDVERIHQSPVVTSEPLLPTIVSVMQKSFWGENWWQALLPNADFDKGKRQRLQRRFTHLPNILCISKSLFGI